jgi:archaeal flagellar protein FlaJ
MVSEDLRRMVACIGFMSINEFIIKFALPVIGMITIFSILTKFIFLNLPFFFPYIIFVFGILFVVIYPWAMFQKKKVNINENLHLMITYAGTLSTVDIQRNILFRRLSDAKRFGEISNMTEKILYLAKSWNLGFSQASRKMALNSPSNIFGDFLDRFAVMMDFGQNLKVFLLDEQDAVMDDFASEYKKSLESIRLLQEVFVSLTIAIAFTMATSLLLPVIMGTSIDFVVQVSLGVIIFVDIGLYFIVKSFVPADALCHQLPIKDKGTRIVIRNFYIFAPISIFFTLFLLYIDKLPFLFNFAIGLSPLMIVGIYAQKHESEIYARDLAFPSFIRALGSVVEVRLGAVISSLRSLQVHDFGVLNDLVIGLYRRLRLGSDKFKCWLYFAAESGSNLITNFSQIFAESVYLGGNAEKIGELVSKNFSRLLSLRKLRLQLASSVRGAFYGSLVGFASASYVSAKITEMLATIFSSPLAGLSGGEDPYMASVISSIAPVSTLEINFLQISIYIGIMIIIHSLISSLIIKIVDGGNYYAALFDFIIMLWIGAFISWILPSLIDTMMPGMGENLSNGTIIDD